MVFIFPTLKWAQSSSNLSTCEWGFLPLSIWLQLQKSPKLNPIFEAHASPYALQSTHWEPIFQTKLLRERKATWDHLFEALLFIEVSFTKKCRFDWQNSFWLLWSALIACGSNLCSNLRYVWIYLALATHSLPILHQPSVRLTWFPLVSRWSVLHPILVHQDESKFVFSLLQPICCSAQASPSIVPFLFIYKL